MIRAALQGSLRKVQYEQEPIFGLYVPTSCPAVPAEILWPKSTWKDEEAYDRKGRELAQLFKANFEQFQDKVEPAVLQAGPQV
jgi:phosphoenolpyruvate carboxykinase (ATP)